MTQGAECEKTRAPNYLFACMRKKRRQQKGGQQMCRTSGLRRRLVRNITHGDIQTLPPPLFSTQYIDDTLLYFTRVFSSGVLVQRLKTVQICYREKKDMSSRLLCFLSALPLRGRRSQSPASASTLSSHTN